MNGFEKIEPGLLIAACLLTSTPAPADDDPPIPNIAYAEQHAYSIPFTGSGTLESVSAIARSDLVAFHQQWFKPNNAALIVVGDTRMSDIKPQLEQYFGAWTKGAIPRKNVASPSGRERSAVYVADRPGSQQSVIVGGHVMPPYSHPDKLPPEVANQVRGGSFTARLNMNLREDKHWSYGARSAIVAARGPRPFFAYASVQTDKPPRLWQRCNRN